MLAAFPVPPSGGGPVLRACLCPGYTDMPHTKVRSVEEHFAGERG